MTKCGFAIAAIICGLSGLGLGIIPILGFIPPILGVVFGFIALSKIKKNPELGGKGLAITGIVTGFIGLVLPLMATIGAIAYFGVLSPTRMIPP